MNRGFNLKRFIRFKFFKGCVQLLLAAALLLLSTTSAESSNIDLRTEGLPYWLRTGVERSIRSVWSEITSSDAPHQTSSEIKDEHIAVLAVVAERIFIGYKPSISLTDFGILVSFKPESPVYWNVEIKPPPLSSPVKEWFEESAEELVGNVERMLGLLPIEALSWADIALKEALEAICTPLLPGWGFSLMVRLQERYSDDKYQEETRVLQLSFYPKPPLVLAIVPSISSKTLPVAFSSDLKERILRSLAPVVGLPIEWAAKHKLSIESLAAEALMDTNTVSNARAAVDVSFSPDQLSSVEAEVESPRYSIRAWIAAYAGSSGKYPEMGLHLGRKALPFSGWDVELYGEWVLAANDFSLQSRWGFRWSPWKNILIGAEKAFPGNELWYRLSVLGGARSPYFWWRISEEGDSVIGIGYRIDQRISLELHYDGRDEDKLTLRAISDL